MSRRPRRERLTDGLLLALVMLAAAFLGGLVALAALVVRG